MKKRKISLAATIIRAERRSNKIINDNLSKVLREEIHTPKYTREDIPSNFHSICPAAERELALICKEGDEHYGEWNWTNVDNIERFRRDTIKHLMAHLNSYRTGDRSELHLGKVMWGCMALIHHRENCKHEEGLK